jgi:hypothetical protein
MRIRRKRSKWSSARKYVRGAARIFRIELLEPRLTMSVDASPFAPTTFTTQANGLPILTSFPNAPAMIFLDYDGDASQDVSELNLDNTPGVFSPFEQQRIYEHWRGLSDLYSMFNVGVTTVQPDTATVPTEWIAITNDMLTKGGVNGVGTFPDDAPSGVSGADWWAEGYSHEISHGFGNWHQSTYDVLGNKTAEYGPPPIDDPLHAAIMGAGSGTVLKWVYGHSSLDGKTIQKDVDTISASLDAIDGTGDGFRPDDQLGTSTATATALTVVDSTTQAKIGIIERLTDQDWYSFASAGDTYNILVGRDNPSPVDAKISIYNSAGTLIASDDGDPLTAVTAGSANYRTMVNDSHVTMNLAAGTYYVKVESHGNYDDLGRYIVRVDRMMDGWESKEIGLVESPGFTKFEPATGTFSVGGSGRGISGTTSDGGDSAQFAYTKLTGDGDIIARVSSMETVTNVIRAGITMRESLATGSKTFAVFTTPSNGIYQLRRTSTDGDTTTQSTSNFSFSPRWLRIKRAGNSFTAYYGSDGVNWTQIGSTQTVAMGTEVYVGLVSTSENDLDRLTANFLSTATFSNVQVFSHADIGAVGVTGTTTYNSVTGTYTLTGNGLGWGNIASQQDASHVYWRHLAGDGSITAHVASISSSSATAGVMIRESLNVNSKYFATWVKPNQGVVSSLRSTTGGTSSESILTPTSYWLRIERSGNIFRSYSSTDGIQWTQIGIDQVVAMNANALIGLMVATGNTITINTSTFDNLTLTGGIDVSQALNNLAAPTNVAVSGVTSTSANLTWTNPNVPLPGDFNLDGTVDTSDYTIWRKTGGPQADYDSWRTNFGRIQSVVTGYSIERSINNVDFDTIGTTAADMLTFTDSTLSGAQKYYYRVRTADAVGASTPSIVVSATARPAAVTGLKVTSYSNNTLVIEWIDASGESSYKLQRSTNGTSGWTAIGSSSTGKNNVMYVDSGRSSATKYYYRVTTVDANGDSATSDIVSAYTRVNSTPVVTFSSPVGSAVTLSWSALSGMTSYAVYRGRGNGINEWDLLTPSNITTTSFTDTDVTPLSEYHYRIVGYNANGAASLAANVFGSSGPNHVVSSPWTSQDIGAVGGVGAADLTNGTFTLVGGGADIWGTSDAFRYAYVPMTGDGYIEARVASMKDPAVNYYSRAGFQIRESTAVGSKQVSLMLHTTDAGVRLQYRTSTNGGTAETLGPTDARAPYYLRLERSGNTFTAKVSPNGTTWTTVGSFDVTMGASVLIGMALTPRDNSYLYWATFDHVSSSVTGTSGAGTGSETQMASGESLPKLPESVFASGAIGAYGSSSALQALANSICQCCAFDCGIAPIGPPQEPFSSGLQTGVQFNSDTQARLVVMYPVSEFGNSIMSLVGALGSSFAPLGAFQNSAWNFSQAYGRARHDAFANLDAEHVTWQNGGWPAAMILRTSQHEACDDDSTPSENEIESAITHELIQLDTQSGVAGARISSELDDSLTVIAGKVRR